MPKYDPEGCSRPLRLAFSEMMRIVHGEAVDTVHSHEELVNNVAKKEKELEWAISHLTRLIEEAADAKEYHDTIYGNLAEWFWGDKSTLAEKKRILNKCLAEYDRTVSKKEHIESELQDAYRKLQLAGEVAEDLLAVVKNLKENMSNEDFIRL